MEQDTLYAKAGEVLTKLTLDTRAAVADVTDQETRAYAFELVHLCRNLLEELTSGIWGSTEDAGKKIFAYLVKTSEQSPEKLPDWAQKLAPTWKQYL